MIRFFEQIIERTNKWYTKSSLPITVKEIIFVVIVLTCNITMDLYEWITKKKT